MSEKVKVVRAFLREIASKGGKANAANTDMRELGKRGASKRWANHVKKGRKGKGK